MLYSYLVDEGSDEQSLYFGIEEPCALKGRSNDFARQSNNGGLI